MYVIPAEGLTVPDPQLRDHLPATGREVPRSDYWMRRLRDGDVIETVTPRASGDAPMPVDDGEVR
ncbi:DUF2635 domain-containing protein [Falsiroseomonas sp. CW058]|uniref:DUF2635 domain-containing protein n=1 Tax=Falsiroseomonas sp. CW058 TaxID=3388664 RepID=UPI003D31D2DA